MILFLNNTSILIENTTRLDMVWIRSIVFNATFKNISVISWRSVLLVEETGVPVEKQRATVSH